MTTLYDALLETAMLCGVTKGGQTTAQHSTPATNLIDTNRYEPDDYFNNGLLFIRSGTYAGSTRRITDYVMTTGVITFAATSTAISIASGIYYTATNTIRDELVQAINEALLMMGEYTEVDETLTVVDNATEYTLPTGVSNVKRIEVYTVSTAPYGFNPLFTWRELGGKIYLPAEINRTAGNTIRIYYNKHHSHVNADADAINDLFNIKRLAWTATAMFLMNRMQYSGNSDEREMLLFQNAQMQVQRLASAFPVSKIERDPILARY